MNRFFIIAIVITTAAMAVFNIGGIVQVSAQKSTSPTSEIKLNILSSDSLSGVAGDYVTIKGTISNSSAHSIHDITTYLSLVDISNKIPVDLEDWSAEKGLYIGLINGGQTFPLNWKIHFVKAGKYSLAVVANISGQETPQVSTLTKFSVLPKKNLNPGHVLPVAFGIPLLLLLFFALIHYSRQKKVIN